MAKNDYVKTHPYQKKLADKVGFPHKIYIHAEIHAILKCRNINKAHSIFISRYDFKGNPKNAKPCEICQEAIKLAKIKHIEYTVES